VSFYTDDIHKLIGDGLRSNPAMRWGTSWISSEMGSPATITVTNTATGQVFEITVREKSRTCRDEQRCRELGICICGRDDGAGVEDEALGQEALREMGVTP
jgi:hypothetical protein